MTLLSHSLNYISFYLLNLIWKTLAISFHLGADRIIFPSEFEEYKRTQTRLPTTGIRFSNGRFVPKGCSGNSPVCASTEDYPTDYINQIVQSNRGRFHDFFGDDIVPEVVQRVDYPDEEPLCHSKEIVMYPTIGQTKDNKWTYIVNNGNFSQGVRVEQCL